MTEYQDPAGESELRRRAAGLLGMLIVVAALVVTLMLLFLNGGSGKPSPNGIKPLPTAPTTSHAAPPTAPPTRGHGQHSTPSGTSHSPSPQSTHSAHTTNHKHHSGHKKHGIKVPPRVRHHRVNCPGAAPCIANGDIGNAVVAINAYRVRHGERAVSGAVTRGAQLCALTNGGQCPDGWAETQVPRATGAAAVRKVAALTDLLDHKLALLEVGWAYYPAGHEYFFAVIRKDA